MWHRINLVACVAGAAAMSLWAGALPANEMTYNANTEMAASETGGAPALPFGEDNVWSLGYRRLTGQNEGANGTAFHSFIANEHGSAEGASGWRLNGNGNPAIAVNATGAPLVYGLSGTMGIGQIVMHPGVAGEMAVVRWTAPRPGTVNISAVFSAVDAGANPATTDVHLVKNGKSLFAGQIDATTTKLDASKSGVPVSAGDTIDALVGYGANKDYNADMTGVYYSVTYQVPKLSSTAIRGSTWRVGQTNGGKEVQREDMKK